MVAKPPSEVPEVATGLQDDDEANPGNVWPASGHDDMINVDFSHVCNINAPLQYILKH